MNRTIAITCLAVVGCAGARHDSSSTDAAPPLPSDGGPCNVVITHETPLLPAAHVDQGTVIDTWNSNPPSSGTHYPTHAAWAIDYPIVIDRGNYLHNEEHGGIVLLHNCMDENCTGQIGMLATIGQALPQDPTCVSVGVNAKWLVTRDPLLDSGVFFAAAAWGWTFKATCIDQDRLSAFITARYSMGGPARDQCDGPLFTP